MAIIKRSDADVGPQPGLADGSIAVEEAPAAPAADPAPPAPQGAVKSMAETLPAALEPELRRIIDTAVARVAAIELEAIHEARELTQRSEKEAREALRFALDRAFNLIATLELLASTVSGMADALKIELDDAIDALRKVPEPESELAKELAQRAPAQEAPTPEPEPVAVRRRAGTRAGACRCPTAAARPGRAGTAEQLAGHRRGAGRRRGGARSRGGACSRGGAARRGPWERLPTRRAAGRVTCHGDTERAGAGAASPSRSRAHGVRAAASEDGGMVPARRRGLMRRLFAK